jgi:hypothetical protein
VPLRLSPVTEAQSQIHLEHIGHGPSHRSEHFRDFVVMFDTSITDVISQSETLAFDTCRLMSRCIPLRSFDYTYEYLFALNRSFIARYVSPLRRFTSPAIR